MKELTFTLPDAIKPVSQNALNNKHWGAIHRMKKKYQNDAGLILNARFNSKNYDMLEPPVGCYINYRFADNRHRDQDNYTSGSGKWLLDLLKEFWNGDDTAEDCCLYVTITSGCDKSETLIRIVEIESEDE